MALSKPDAGLVALVRAVYPLVVNRHDARVQLLALAHTLLTDYAVTTGRHPEDWPDMALRVMLEYEHAGG